MDPIDSTTRLVRTWFASGRDQEIDETVSGIVDGQTTLLHVVKALGEYLTADEDGIRTKGIEFLSAVLARCPPEQVNRQSARTLVSFYCSKLDDTETIIPALKGLVPLSSLPTFTSSDAVETMKALARHVNMRAQVQSTRYLVFSIIDSLLARHRDALKNMGVEFLSGYTSLVEGEKDPRNLVISFSISRVILLEFDIAAHVESLYDITFCYFPISFRPPPGTDIGVTAEDLRESLRGCLSATPAFGPPAIPFFLDKLLGGSPTSKRDTLQTLATCLPVYGSALAASSARKLWSALKPEIFQPVDSEIESDALKATQALVCTIYKDRNQDNSSIEGFGKDVCGECMEVLREPEKNQAKPAIKVLCAFISTTPSVSRYTVLQVVPHLVKLFLDPDEISNRLPTLTLFASVLQAVQELASSDTPSDVSEEGLLAPFKDEVLGVCTVGLKTPSICPPALEGLKSMTLMKGLLTDEELGFIVHNVNEVLESDQGHENAISEILDLLSTISAVSPRHVEQTTLPLLFSSLPDRAPPLDAVTEREKYWRILASLKTLCVPPTLFETLVIRLSTKLDLICSPTLSSPDSDPEPSAAYAHALLKTLGDVLETKVNAKHADIPKYVDRLVPRLFNLHLYAALVPTDPPMIAADPRVLSMTAPIITIIVGSLAIEQQQLFAESLFSAYLSGDIRAIAEGHQKLPDNVTFRPLEDGATFLQKNLLALFAAAVIAFHKELRVHSIDTTVLLNKLLIWYIHQADNETQRKAAVHVIASMVNKSPADLTSFISEQPEAFWHHEILNAAANTERRRLAIRAWTWIAKALVVRNHPSASQYVDRLFELFDDENIGWDAAKALGQIGSSDDILTKEHNAVVKLLYAQRFFNGLLPRILAGAKEQTIRHQSSFLVALSSLIKSLPSSIYAQEMPKLMPLLLRGLELPDPDMLADVIDTLAAAAATQSSDQKIIAEHASSLVPILLRNCNVTEMPTTRVRVAALRYLGILPSIVRYDVLHPQKSIVIRELGKVVDDPKRSVRKEAVGARGKWYMYNG